MQRDARKTCHWSRLAAALSLALCVGSGCYHYRVTAPRPTPATDYEKQTVHAFFWGMVEEDASAKDCKNSNALDEVRVTTNMGYQLASVFSLGIWSPLDVEWRCAKAPPRDGEL